MEESKKGVWIGLGVLAAAAIGGVLYLRSSGAPKTVPSEVIPGAAPARAPEGPADLPKLAESDAYVREKLAALLNNPKFSAWLQTDNLVRRLTAAAAIIADGKSPRDSLKFLAPDRPFAVLKKGGVLVIDPKSYARYDLVGGLFDALPAPAAARLFADLKPLFQQAYEELGGAKGDFQETLVRAINVLLAVPTPPGDVEVRKRVVSYAMTDERLENLSPAQKHLLRMGPANAAKVQAKLRAFSQALVSGT